MQAEQGANMRTTRELNEAIRDRLEHLGIQHDAIRVFGTMYQQIQVTCTSRAAAIRWMMLLRAVTKVNDVACIPHTWGAGSRSGWLIAVTA
jgi:hypothetical protein